MEPYAFDALIESLSGAYDTRIITSALSNFAHSCGFEWFAYVDAAGTDIQTLSDYPQEWQSRYLSEGYSIVDPVIINGRSKIAPFLWDKHTFQTRLSKEQRRFFGEAEEFGIRSGVAIPVFAGFGRIAMLTLAAGSKVNELPLVQNPMKATAAATYLHLYLQMAVSEILVGKQYKLTSRQLTCLKWAANNKTHKEIGAILNIGESAVRKHLDKARDILGAGGIKNAIYIATKNCLI